ncbi:hypothetical protein [Allomuricauda sp. F6463D]|uniref:hypothetical protein n=1 Tax=Allomuricauda sp. F6463D TaxID=2926409 RepID=UPI001FF25407|nr:hypothetical protein [Muricauda sp. F6463D]MCK0159119.1 hypothetical protein [Muricauda sp. F6463D]
MVGREIERFLVEYPQLFDSKFYKGNYLGQPTFIKVIARSCGYDEVAKFQPGDLSTYCYEMHRLTGIAFTGNSPIPMENF